ncbi:carbon monoxide dehydrogenase subunit G [Streptomyces sp. SID3343]|uniref:SRPBCC family protein n=1 Tax=Streptomyces sp. SID3343 TaxID=2690260 RepID=UPI00136D7B22|nr:carbon monoxide dehydrogenase subunit G [Streptomyces sp. SID3343]MYW00554.1 carbon monoxide dehydrogenase [Streptomyces sp. SID3343]
MKVQGNAILNAPADKVWAALNDPAVLTRTIPGCEKLEETGPDAYRMTVTMGVASIKGTYLGNVQLTDQVPPGSFLLKASGSGGPGTVAAEVKVTLEDLDGGRTRLEYDAEAVVGGVIGGVGQRMLTGVAKKTAGEFFKSVDNILTGKTPLVPATTAAANGSPAAASTDAAPTGVYAAPAAASPLAGIGGDDFAKGALFGAAVALLGAIVGGVIARRR